MAGRTRCCQGECVRRADRSHIADTGCTVDLETKIGCDAIRNFNDAIELNQVIGPTNAGCVDVCSNDVIRGSELSDSAKKACAAGCRAGYYAALLTLAVKLVVTLAVELAITLTVELVVAFVVLLVARAAVIRFAAREFVIKAREFVAAAGEFVAAAGALVAAASAVVREVTAGVKEFAAARTRIEAAGTRIEAAGYESAEAIIFVEEFLRQIIGRPCSAKPRI
jgi:hypothetical protein